MSAWQSFFNQLSKPVKDQKLALNNHVCRCEKGSLVINDKNTFIQNKNCSLEKFCCILQMDKFRAQTFGKGILISPTENYVQEKSVNSSKIFLELYIGE